MFRGGTLIFSYIRRLGPFLGGSKFIISIFLGVFRKNNIVLGYENFVDFLGVIPKMDYFYGLFQGKYTESGYFWGLQKFKIFFFGA